jgi:23S rRNA (adenine2030-N6)-methyltransferase
MNYRHAYHAGNFADVHKHVALVAVLLHFRKKQKPFAVIDTHAGAGLYELSGAEARKTSEAAAGIEKLRGHAAQTPTFRQYLEIVNSCGAEHYPGSPLLAAKLLRPQDRLVAIEKQPDQLTALEASLAPFSHCRAILGDGYGQLDALLPPPERRGIILVDPPYEAADEMERLAQALGRAHRRFATGTFVIWHPLKTASDVRSLVGEIQAAGPMRLLSLTIDVGVEDQNAAAQLRAAGLLIVNPPFGLDVEMEAAGAELLPLLRRGRAARLAVDWLSAVQ